MTRFNLRAHQTCLISGLLLALFVAHAAPAAVPERMNFQGILLDSGGDPVADGPHAVTFSIYNVAVGGTVYWAETTSVATTGGLFNIILGTIHPIPDSAIYQFTWVGIAVSPDPELTPRTLLTSVSHAYRVGTVSGATGGTVTGSIHLQGAASDDFLAVGAGDPNTSIEMRSGSSGGDPYIDLSNDAVSDFDTRLQLLGDDGLAIEVDSTLAVPSGRLGLGTTTPGEQPGLESVRLEIADETGLHSDAAFRVAGGGVSALSFAKSTGTLASPTVVSNGNSLGYLIFIGHDGSDYNGVGAWIRARVDGIPGDNDMPGRLEFSTTLDGLDVPTTRMVITNSGAVGIGTANPASALDVSSTNGALIVPRISTAARDALTAVNGMIIYNTTDNQFNFRENGAWVTK